MILWIDAQLSPALARWLSDTFGVTAHAVPYGQDTQLPTKSGGQTQINQSSGSAGKPSPNEGVLRNSSGYRAIGEAHESV